jgi:hypothetical protein
MMCAMLEKNVYIEFETYFCNEYPRLTHVSIIIIIIIIRYNIILLL